MHEDCFSAPLADYASMRGGVPWIPNSPLSGYQLNHVRGPEPKTLGIGYSVSSLTLAQREYLTLIRPDLLRSARRWWRPRRWWRRQ